MSVSNNQTPKRNMFLRALLWLLTSEIRAVLMIAFTFLIYLLLKFFDLTFDSGFGVDVKLMISLFIFGVFGEVLIVTDSSKKYKKNGELQRAVCGAIAGLTIGLIYSVSGEALFLMTFVGIILGTFGRRLLDGL
jgi:hypothetical protein